MDPLSGLAYDLSLTATRHRPGTDGEPVAVVVLDNDSLSSEELARTPRVFLGPYWAKTVDALREAGVKAIGFDIIFSYSADGFPALQGDYDKSFRDALARMNGRVVLARTAGAYPALPFVAAISDIAAPPSADEPDAIAYAEMIADSDGVQRQMRSALQNDKGQVLPTLAAALLARGHEPAMPRRLLLAPAAPLEAMPTYRLIDVLRCADREPGALRSAFTGKIVLIGTNLPEEDRKRGPDRFMAPAQPHPGSGAGCRLDRLGASDAGSGTIPGVFLHAAAVEAVMTGSIVGPAPALVRAGTAVAASFAGSLLGFAVAPWMAIAGIVVLAAGVFALALSLLPFGLWLPVTIPVVAAALSMVLAYLVRFLGEERRRRRVEDAFDHYLAPSLVAELADSETKLRLGGEAREVTIMFADLSGFTALSGRVGPEVLMEVTNHYLGLIVEAVEATGGYVDKFIGDAVMAVWGAPVLDPDHAAHAARAALASVGLVTAAKADADAAGLPGYSVKMGINTGPAVVGNVGAPRRYNYTAIGESVNIAARLEGVPHDYGCAIVIGPPTAAVVADGFVICELDWIKVKGKAEAIAIYDLLAENGAASPAELAYPALYMAALALYRAGDFVGAEAVWQATAYPRISADPLTPPQVMAARCAELRADPPVNWDGIFVKTTK